MVDIEPAKSSYLRDLQSIRSPSFNRDTNRNTFAYRLSELVFGSLLASYILGFISFASASAVATPGHINLIMTSLFSWTSIVILQQLLISILYSAFTALLYVNFHQSILYLSTNQRKSSTDFILAMAIGISFGISMIFPLSTIFWLGLLTAGVFLRRDNLLKAFTGHVALKIAEETGGKILAGSAPGGEQDSQKNLIEPIIPEVMKALMSSQHPVIRSWVSETTWGWKVGIGAMVSLPIAAFVAELIYWYFFGTLWLLGDYYLRTATTANVAGCAAVSVFFLRRQYVATHTMPSQENREDTKLDDALNNLLRPVKAQILLTAKTE